MKLKIALVIITTAFSVPGQSAFQNLDFEAATLSPIPPDDGGGFVPISSGLPGWTGYLGDAQQTQVQQNNYTLGSASIDILGPYFQPVYDGIFAAYVISGNYTVLLEAGAPPGGISSPDNAAIAQDGTIPATAQSVQWQAWEYPNADALAVSFGGNSLSPVMLATGQNSTGLNYVVYGANIAPYAGQTGTLEFSEQYTPGFPTQILLDDIAFSTQAVPEPSSLVLTSLGGLLWALSRRCARSRR